jgi:hypothetical protein
MPAQSALLKSAHVKQSETETQLALARSNLQMAQANTDLLDDALKRANASARSSAPPSGWRHSSADSSASGPAPETPTSPDSAGVAEPKREKEGFFASFGRAHGPPPQALAALRGQNHAASASMPSLLPAAGADAAAAAAAADAAKKQVEDLTKALDAERARSEKAAEDKTALEGELESLSQALFEEVCLPASLFTSVAEYTLMTHAQANKMVASERMRAAEAAEEATEAARQRDALAQALRVLEAENLALKASAARAGASGAPIAGPADGASSGSGAGSGGAEAPHRRRPSVASLAAPVPRPPRSPLRRAASLSASSLSSGAGSRPSSPLVSSPLRAASRAGSSPHSSPHTSPGMSASASLPTLGTLGALGLSANGDDEPTPPAHARAPLPALAFEEATPPGTSAARPSQLSREGSALARSGGDAPAPWKRPVPMRRATSQLTTRPDPDYHDPNLPDDDAPDAAAAPERATPPLFTLPPLPSFSALQSIAQSLPASPAAASAALSAWFDVALARRGRWRRAGHEPARGDELPNCDPGAARVAVLHIVRGGAITLGGCAVRARAARALAHVEREQLGGNLARRIAGPRARRARGAPRRTRRGQQPERGDGRLRLAQTAREPAACRPAHVELRNRGVWSAGTALSRAGAARRLVSSSVLEYQVQDTCINILHVVLRRASSPTSPTHFVCVADFTSDQPREGRCFESYGHPQSFQYSLPYI